MEHKRKSQVADRSVSVPMTFSDPEKQTRGVKLFHGISVIRKTNMTQNDQICGSNICGGRAYFQCVRHAPSSGAGPQLTSNFCDTYLRPYGLTYSNQIWYGNASGEERVSGDQIRPLNQGMRSPGSQKIFVTSCMRTHRTRNNNQILHGEQTRCEEKFYRVAHALCPDQSICYSDANLLASTYCTMERNAIAQLKAKAEVEKTNNKQSVTT